MTIPSTHPSLVDHFFRLSATSMISTSGGAITNSVTTVVRAGAVVRRQRGSALIIEQVERIRSEK